MKFFLPPFCFIVCMFMSCNNHRHDEFWEDEQGHFDTLCNMLENQLPIDVLNKIPNKKFTIGKVNSDSLFMCTKSVWNKNFASLCYYNDSLRAQDSTYDYREQNRFFIISKTFVNKINIVLLGQNSFNEEEIDFTYLLITDTLNRPLFFCPYESLRHDYILEKSAFTDSTFFTRFGDKNDGEHISFSDVRIKFDLKRRTVTYNSAFHEWQLWE